MSQDEIAKTVGAEAAKGRRELNLDGGPYRVRYTRNGRHMAVVGHKGHVATFDWQTGSMHSELQLGETCRDITYVLFLFVLNADNGHDSFHDVHEHANDTDGDELCTLAPCQTVRFIAGLLPCHADHRRSWSHCILVEGSSSN